MTALKEIKVPEGRLTMTEQFDKIEQLLKYGDKKKDDKHAPKYRLPMKIRFRHRAMARKNQLMIVLLKRNRIMTMEIGQLVDGLLHFGGVAYNGDPSFIFLHKYKGKYMPTVVLPEWSLDPISPEKFKDTVSAQTIILRAMKHASELNKKKLSGRTLIFIGIGAIVIAYLFMQGG